jgi:predicted nucleotidyltransferase
MPHTLSPAEDLLLARFLTRLQAGAGTDAIRRVRVFGSRVRGGSEEHSDLDVAVEAADAADIPRLRRLANAAAEEAMTALGLHALALAPVVLAPGDRGLVSVVAQEG